MSHVEVSAEKHGLLLVQREQVIPERIVPHHAVIEPLELRLAVRGIAGHYIIILVLRSYHPSLIVMLLDSEAIAHRDRLLLRKKRRPGVALLLSIVPVLVVAGQVQIYLALLQLAFLNAEHVRIHILEIVHKALLHAGPYSVHVPGYHLHRHSSFLSKTSYSIFKNHPHGARMVLPIYMSIKFSEGTHYPDYIL